MKVISGILKGRNIDGYNIEGTRPTMDRVKESVFAMIQSNLKGACVLDLFAGSGNYGIEAFSNGAKKIYSNDYNRKCIEVIKKNLIRFNILDNFELLNFDYLKCLNYLNEKNIKFDLVFLDPPYEMMIYKRVINYLSEKMMLNDGALIICETTDANLGNSAKFDNLELIKSKKYGEKYVLIYKNNI